MNANDNANDKASMHRAATADVAHSAGFDHLEHCPMMPVFGAPTVTFVRGSGTELWDSTGKRYLDFLCGLAVTSLGHANAEVATAIAEQANTLVHVSNLFATVPGPQVALTIDRLLGGGGQVFFANSGAEANECAIKVARKWGGYGRHHIISTFGSFHGRKPSGSGWNASCLAGWPVMCSVASVRPWNEPNVLMMWWRP